MVVGSHHAPQTGLFEFGMSKLANRKTYLKGTQTQLVALRIPMMGTYLHRKQLGLTVLSGYGVWIHGTMSHLSMSLVEICGLLALLFTQIV